MKSVPSLSLAVVLSLAACNAGSAPSEAAQPAIEAHVQDVDPDAEKPAERTAETPTLALSPCVANSLTCMPAAGPPRYCRSLRPT